MGANADIVTVCVCVLNVWDEMRSRENGMKMKGELSGRGEEGAQPK